MDPILITIATTVFAGGAAWGGAKAALNGTRERVKRISTELDTHVRDDHLIQRDLVERAARLEAKIDVLLKLKKD